MDALTLSRRLVALPALGMRQAVMREELAELSSVDAARLCGELVRRGRDGAPYDVALIAFNAVLDANELGYERHGEIYAEARRTGDEALALLLLSAQPPPPGVPKPAPFPHKPDITLGERKSLARSSQIERDLLDRLLRDTDPTVLTLLLGNPRVTVPDVVRLAARRPTSAGMQRVIFHSERFVARYPVKRALAFNPYTPSDLAARLVPLLNRVDLKALAGDSAVAEPVRLAAKETLAALP